MTKRLFCLVLLAAMLAFSASAAAADDWYGADRTESGTYYVYTENGRGLNVRESPNGRIVGSLAYGAQVWVVGMADSSWALISFHYQHSYYGTGDWAAYISRRYLVRYQPSPWVDPSSVAPVPYTGDAMEAMNAEFRSARQVTVPFTVVARPARASGWVNLRWAPSTEAERMATCSSGRTLTVLAETANWYQVEDTLTGMIGYISKQYVSAR